MTVVFGHSGHWLVNLVYVGPVLVIAAWIGIQSLRDRRAAARGEKPEKKEP